MLAPMLRVESRPLRAPPGPLPQAVIVTSGNALAALPATLRETRLLAVGDATASRARAIGFARAESARGDAESLLRHVAATCDPEAAPLLLATGSRLGFELIAALHARGFRVARRVAYLVRSIDELDERACAALRQGHVAAALFYSGATARAFAAAVGNAALVGSLATVVALALSPAIAAGLAPLPWRAIRVAPRPDQEALLGCL